MAKNKFKLPEPRVLSLIAGAGIMLALVFWGILGNLVAGIVIGLVFSAAFGGFIFLASANASKQKKRRR